MTQTNQSQRRAGGQGGGHGHSPEMAARHKRDQAVFHELLKHHAAIERRVENLPDGIRSVTESDDVQLAGKIRVHAREMHRRMGEGFSLRHWDPAFAEIFAQAGKVRMEIRDTERGVAVTETSQDPNVVKLIQTHGQTVSGFVKAGGRAASQPTPLPEGYIPARR